MEEMYYHWLYGIPGIGNITMKKILERATPKTIFFQGTGCLEALVAKDKLAGIEKYRKEKILQESWSRLQKDGITLYYLGGPDYPEKLKNIPDPPIVLYKKGSLLPEGYPTVAVIGARNCSSYGKMMAEILGEELARNQITVISGMAKGIDGISQWSALEAGGKSIGVLGSGVQVCYPVENRRLYERLLREGCVVSENLPYTAPAAGLFPRRNRIISGMADIIVVVEAREKSGTLITVDMALEQGREVYCIPGRTTDRLSLGCNRLIKMGAAMIVSVEDFVEEICGLFQCEYQKKKRIKEEEINAREKKILKVLEYTPLFVEEIWGRIQENRWDISFSQLLEDLLELQLKGKVIQEGQSHYRLKSIH